jgi:transcriptional regulator with XRE-family HTH domain
MGRDDVQHPAPREDRKHAGLTVEQAARRLRISLSGYRELKAGERWSSWETYERICGLFGWPRSSARRP